MLHTPVPRSAPDAEQLLSVAAVPGLRAGRVVVEVVGEVDAYTAPLLEACLHSQTIRAGVREIVVDLARVTFLGAAGVAVLARTQQSCASHGVGLVLRTGGRRHVVRPLELTRLSDLVPVDPAGPNRPRSPGTPRRRRSGPRRPAVRRPRHACS